MKYMCYNWPKIYNKEEIKGLVDYAYENVSTNYIDVPAFHKKVDTFVFDINNEVKLFDKLFQKVTDTNTHFFGFDIFNYNLAKGNFNYYHGEQNEYKFHRDAENPDYMNDIKLTAILNVSDEVYEGGKFLLYDGEEVSVDGINNPGDLLIFPSFFYHAVTPVTKGKRKSISFWFKGPHWR